MVPEQIWLLKAHQQHHSLQVPALHGALKTPVFCAGHRDAVSIPALSWPPAPRAASSILFNSTGFIYCRIRERESASGRGTRRQEPEAEQGLKLAKES